MRIPNRALFTVFISSFFLLLVVSTGCTKKDTAAHEAALLSSLPPTTVGFYTFHTDVPGYQKLRAQNWASWSESALKDLDQHLTALDPANGQAIASIIQVVKESGLITDSPEKPDGIKEGVLFFTALKDEVAAGMYLHTSSEVKAPELAKQLIAHLQKARMQVTSSEDAGITQLAITGKDPQGTSRTMYLSAQQHKIALSSQKEISQRFFASSPTDDGFKIISSSPQYQQIMSEITSEGERFGYGYFDIAKMKEIAATLPLGADKELIQEIPFAAAAISQSIQNGVATHFAFSLTPTNDQQKLLISNLERMPENSLASKIPSDSVIYLGIDGQLIKTLEEGAISELTPEQKEFAKQWISSISSLKGIGVTFKNGAGDSPFPDIILTAQSTSSNALYALIQDGIDAAIAGQVQTSQWMTKDVAGVPVTYMLTPLGVGIFLADTGEVVIVSSTESAMKSALTAHADPKATLLSTIPSETRATLTSQNSLVNSYANFPKLGDLIESVQSSMALFTGGANPVNASQIQGIRRMGAGAFSIKISKGYLRGQFHVKPQEQ